MATISAENYLKENPFGIRFVQDRSTHCSNAQESCLTSNEGALLAMIVQCQPITAYRATKLFKKDPIGGFNESPGQVYPAIRRMENNGLVIGELDPEDARHTKKWSCTEIGKSALKRWILDLDHGNLTAADPLSAKIMQLKLLEYDERLQWIEQAKANLESKFRVIESNRNDRDPVYTRMVTVGIMAGLKAKMDWMDRVFVETVKGGE